MDASRVDELILVLQKHFVIFLTKERKIELRNWDQYHTYHTFENWEACQAWVEQEWDEADK